MTKLEVGKEYWFKGKVVTIDAADDRLPHAVDFNRRETCSWLRSEIEAVEAIPEREKVTIPKEVADWIIGCREHGYDFAVTLDNGLNDSPKKVQDWLLSRKNQDTFARAWLDGYEIEKEPLYWVRDKKGYSLIIRNHSVTQRSSGSSVSYQEHHREFFTFTEKEIKDYDERFMAFSVPAEEE